ncbi:muscleblind-like protein 1 isoform X4 [Cylas formicarius]|uniref:muscleblind-like protein 1 isoform X4 n=1 Tax=Cylas formicarius TaxID=197179 RepID=UPI00295896B0|nr:muscleblind-like protein 1 isoform X4 [Cylas formicarius]
MAMVNLLNGKDSRWLQLEVCREFQRNKCSRPDTECKFAHPPANVEVQNGRVTACYDSIKGRCNREKPPCKYFHPPQHLKDQLLINGRNHLALKNALMQQMGLTPGQQLVPGQVQAVAANPYLAGMPQVGSTYSPYFAPGPIMPTIMGPDPTGVGSPLGVVPQTVVTQQKMPRSDRLEMDMKSVGSFYYDNFAFPAGMVPYKRPAADKSGVPVYQPNATTYQQLVQLQQPFVPVSCEYSTSPAPPPTSSSASPSATEQAAAAAAAAAALHPAMSSSLSNPQQQQQQQQQQLSKENEPQPLQIPASITTTASLTSLPAQQLAAMTDPAAIAKEVAQQNYAKAVKLAAVNQSLAASQLNALNPLNYTGVSLNKQTINVPPPTAALRYPSTAIPFTFNAAAAAAAAGLNLGLTHNPYSAAAFAQQNLLNVARPPPAMTAFQFNPYSLMRPGYANANPAAAATPLLGGNFLGAQYPVVSAVAAAPTATVPAATSTIAAAAAQNNNNVVVQPYKKLKTS